MASACFVFLLCLIGRLFGVLDYPTAVLSCVVWFVSTVLGFQRLWTVSGNGWMDRVHDVSVYVFYQTVKRKSSAARFLDSDALGTCALALDCLNYLCDGLPFSERHEGKDYGCLVAKPFWLLDSEVARFFCLSVVGAGVRAQDALVKA